MRKVDSWRTIRGGLLSILFTLVVAACDSVSEPQQLHTLGEGDPEVLAKMHDINAQLRARGLNIAVQEITFFTIGEGRPSTRLLQREFRWVPNDPRRLPDGTNITYIVAQSQGDTTNGLTNSQTEAAIDRSMQTWNADRCMSTVEIVKRPDPGTDITIFDSFFGFGDFGDYLAADIVNAGWYPRAFFEAAAGPGAGRSTLGFSITFIWADENNNPTDINNDGYLDTAVNEVYYNDTFGDPADDRADNPWGINVALPGIDVETVALHENAHSLGVSHFGPEPPALMNSSYTGIIHSPYPTDSAAMCTVWAQWPNK